MFGNVVELIEMAKHSSIADIMIDIEIKQTGKDRQEIIDKMDKHFKVMEDAIKLGLDGIESLSGLTGYDGKRLKEYLDRGVFLTDKTAVSAIAYAIGTGEVNAAMGVICVAPTAGAAGVIPAVLFALKDKLNLDRKACLDFLFTAGAMGLIVANNATISGATGGCQAEVGSASAMAAAAAVAVAGGTPEQSAVAFSLALQNMLGLVCDPVAGLVEIPCINRNVSGAMNALASAEIALAGVSCKIPADEVIEAMRKIGEDMCVSLRETADGGLATTKSGEELRTQSMMGS